jgi:hypothetical protein
VPLLKNVPKHTDKARFEQNLNIMGARGDGNRRGAR